MLSVNDAASTPSNPSWSEIGPRDTGQTKPSTYVWAFPFLALCLLCWLTSFLLIIPILYILPYLLNALLTKPNSLKVTRIPSIPKENVALSSPNGSHPTAAPFVHQSAKYLLESKT